MEIDPSPLTPLTQEDTIEPPEPSQRSPVEDIEQFTQPEPGPSNRPREQEENDDDMGSDIDNDEDMEMDSEHGELTGKQMDDLYHMTHRRTRK